MPPAVEAHVECSGAVHRVGVEEGVLQLLDHDAVSEEVLRALGADGSPCLTLLQVRKHPEKLWGLVWYLIAGATESDLESHRRLREVLRARRVADPVMQARLDAQVSATDNIELILGLPDGFRMALAISILGELERGWEYREERSSVGDIERLTVAVAQRTLGRAVSRQAGHRTQP